MSDLFYIADSDNHKIRVMTSEFVVTTLAGSGAHGSADGIGAEASFADPYGLAVNADGDIYVPELSHLIRKVTPAGVVTTVAGSGYGHADGVGAAASFYYPRDCTFDGDGNCYITDCFNHTIRKMTPDYTVSTLAGLAEAHGTADGTGSAARFYQPFGIAYDPVADCLYVTDEDNGSLRKVTLGGVVTTVVNGSFSNPKGVACDAAGNIYVSDYGDYTLRRVTPAGAVTLVAGLADTWGHVDGTGSAAHFEYPGGIVVGSDGNVYLLDTGPANVLSRVTPAGVATTVCGTPYVAGDADGAGAVASFYNPFGIALGTATDDTYGANVLINGGACVVFERDVTLALNPGSVAATEMAIRNDEDSYGAWEAFAATKAWTLSAACKVWAKFRDGA